MVRPLQINLRAMMLILSCAALVFAMPPQVSIPLLIALVVAVSMHVVIGVILQGADAVAKLSGQRRNFFSTGDRISLGPPTAEARIRCVVASSIAHVADENDASVRILPNPVVDHDLRQIAKLPGVKWLVLDHTQITDAGLTHLHGLQQLRKIYVRGTRVSVDGLDRLKRALPQLTICADPTGSIDSPST